MLVVLTFLKGMANFCEGSPIRVYFLELIVINEPLKLFFASFKAAPMVEIPPFLLLNKD